MPDNLPAVVPAVPATVPAAPAPVYEHLGPEPGMPVQYTDARLSMLRDAFGYQTARALQSAWNDRVVHRLEEINALCEDHPKFDEIVRQHETADGGLSMKGAEVAAEYLAEQAGLSGADELAKRHPGLHAIFQEHRTHEGVSPVGLYLGLAYVATMTGYKFVYRGAAPQRKEQHMTDTTSPPASPAPVSLQGAIYESNQRIAHLQAQGRTKEANAEYVAQQAMIAERKGDNAPIVGRGGRTA